MSKDMLGIAVRKLVTLPGETLGVVCDLLGKMADWEWVEATKRFLRKEDPWAEAQKAATALLKFVKTVKLPAVAASKPEDYLKVTPPRKRKSAKVVIGYVSDNVKALIKGRSEPEEAEATIRIHELCQASVDGPIMAGLGENAKTGFNRMFQMMEKQGRGQKGDLLVDGRASIFYIEGTDWAVRCFWHSGDESWFVGADPVTGPNAWGAGRQVISR